MYTRTGPEGKRKMKTANLFHSSGFLYTIRLRLSVRGANIPVCPAKGKPEVCPTNGQPFPDYELEGYFLCQANGRDFAMKQTLSLLACFCATTSLSAQSRTYDP